MAKEKKDKKNSEENGNVNKNLKKAMRAANKSTYVTGTGQKLVNVHPKKTCAGPNCCIHNPSNHVMKEFPTHWREDRGIMERICPHGIGHPDPDSPWARGSYQWIHGCDGCCQEPAAAQMRGESVHAAWFDETPKVINWKDPEWVDHDAPPNGIGPVCKYCHLLIDWHPIDHALGCERKIND